MGNLRRASELAAQRKKRHVWRNVVTCIAAFVVFCTTYALILPAITLETQELSCGLPEHTHSAACYQLVCGRQEVYSHTHTRENCYDASGALTCTLREQIAHHHTQDCYSVPQPVCGQVEHAAHTHGETCYAEGALTCGLAETEGHVHTPECYPADFVAQLICGQQDLPEHIHTDACYIRACGLDEHTHTDACAANHREFVDNLVPTGQTESPATETETTETTAAAEATEATGVTETTAPEATGDASVTEAPATESPVTEAPAAPETTQPEASTQPEETTLPDAAVATEAPTDPQPTTETPPQDEDIIEDEDTILEPPMLLGAADTAGGEERLVDVATSVTIKNEKTVNGQPVSGDATYDKINDRIKMNLRIDFSFTVEEVDGKKYVGVKASDNSFIKHGNEYGLNLGDIGLISDLQGGTGRAGGIAVFDYWCTVDANGKAQLHIKLRDDYLQKEAKQHITGYIQMSGWLSADKTDDKGNINHPIDGDVSLVVSSDGIKYEENESRDGDLTLSKQGQWKLDGKKLIYTVTVDSVNGTPGPVSIKDILTSEGLTISGPENVTVQKGSETLQDGYEYTSASEGNKHTLDINLPQLGKGERYTITYEYTLDEVPENLTTVKNTATGTSKKDETGPEIKHEASSEVGVKKETSTEPSSVPTESTAPSEKEPNFRKGNLWGAWNEDKTAIAWTLSVNDNHADIAGKKLVDAMLAERLIDLQKDGLVNGLIVKANWNLLQTQEECGKHFTIEDDTITFNPVDVSGNIREDEKNENEYFITFYTPVGELGKWGLNSVTNTANLGDKEDTSTATEDGGKVEKTTGKIELDKDGNYRISWIAAVTLASDGFTENDSLFLYDNTMPAGEGYSGKHYYDRESIRLFYDGAEMSSGAAFEVTFYDKKDGTEVTADGNATYMVVKLLPDSFNGTATAGKRLTLQYTTYALKDEMDAAGTGNWQNRVDYRTKGDISYASVTPPSLTKFDGKGIPGTTSVKNYNGELDWKVNLTLGSVSNATWVKITDNLPEHVHVLKLSMQAQTPSLGITTAELDIDANGNITGGDTYYVYSGAYDRTNRTVRITVTRQNTTDVMEPLTTFILSLNCKIDDGYLNANAEGTFVNNADGETNDGKLDGSSQTQEWEKLKENPLDGALSKAHVNKNKENTDRILSYTVEINPKGADIQPGSSKVYLTDEFSYEPQRGEYDVVFTLRQSSLKLFYADRQEDGTLVKEEVPSADWRWVVDEDNPGKEFAFAKVTKYIRLEVPDETPLILEYQYVLSGFKEGLSNLSIQVSNKVYFTAYPDEKEAGEDSWLYFDGLNDSAGAYTGQSLKITKLKEGNSEFAIEGAKFQIFQAVKDTEGNWNWQPLMDGDTPRTYTTDESGELTVSYNGNDFSYDVLYMLKETAAAPGYILPDIPPTVKFYFSNEPESDTLPPVGSFIRQGAKDLSSANDYEIITNTASTAEFSVEKIWRDSNGNNVTGSQKRYGSISFDLMRISTEVRQNATVSDPLLSTAKVVIGYGQWNVGKNNVVSFTVPKGAVVTVQVENCGQNASAKLWIPAKNVTSDVAFNNSNNTIAPESKNGTTWTYSFTVTHNVGFGIVTNDNATPILTYSHTAQSTGGGETGETTPLVTKPEKVGRITLSAPSWKWDSTQEPGPLAIRGTVYDATGKERDVWFSYYVVEDAGDYETTYTNVGNGVAVGITSGTITVTNQLPPESAYTSMTVNKVWTNGDTGGHISIPFKLIRKTLDSSPTEDDLKYPEGLTYDALPAGCEVVEEGNLTAENDWTWSKDGLIKEYNGKWYAYFVVEQPGDDYTTEYSSGVTGGTITVTNTITKKPTTIWVEKQWFDYFGKEANNQQGEVRFELYKVAHVGEKASEPEKVGVCYTLSQSGNWKWDSKTAGLDLLAEEWTNENGQQVKVTYTYYVVELVDGNAAEKFTIAYSYDNGKNFVESNTTGISSGTIIIKNTLPSPEYELPATGGAGTLAYTLAGLTLTLTAALTLTATTRKKRPH